MLTCATPRCSAKRSYSMSDFRFFGPTRLMDYPKVVLTTAQHRLVAACYRCGNQKLDGENRQAKLPAEGRAAEKVGLCLAEGAPTALTGCRRRPRPNLTDLHPLTDSRDSFTSTT